MNDQPSVIIAGAGIFGVTAAVELSRRGYAVSLFDPGPLPHPDAASTDISKVARMDYGSEEFYMDMMGEAFRGWDLWNASWPRTLYHQTGALFMTAQGMQEGNFEYESYVRLEQRGIPVNRLDPHSIRLNFPAWNSEIDLEGYFNLRAGWVESGEVVRQLLQEAKDGGVQLHEGVAFAGLSESNGRVDGIITQSGEKHQADVVIAAAGSWTPVLIPSLSDVMQPVGQAVFHFSLDELRIYQQPEFPVWGLDTHTSGWYGFPATAGGILKVANHGPGWQMDQRGARVVPASEERRYREFLSQFLPGLAGAPLASTRLCFYCDTFDGDFWIDHDPTREGLMVCAGDSGHAFKFAPLLGTIIADVLERKPNPYASRFAWRQPKDRSGDSIASAGFLNTPRK